VLASSAGDSAAPGGLFGRTPERDSRSVSEAGVPLLFPEDLHASSRRRIIVSVREARPMDLRTRPFYTVRALRRLSKLPAPPACVDAPAPSAPAPVAPAATQTPARADARVVPVPVPTPTWGATPDAARGATPATVPSAPVRVTAKTPAATATAVPPPALASATSTPPAAPPVTSGPARLPTAPVKHGTAYDWTGLP